MAPGIEMAAASKNYGATGQFAFIPVAVGFVLGAAFVYASGTFASKIFHDLKRLMNNLRTVHEKWLNS